MNFLPRYLVCALLASAPAVLTAALPSVAMPITAPARSEPIGSTFVDWASLEAKATSFGLVRSVFDAPTATMARLELHITTLNPGMSPGPAHHHPWEEMLIIKDGDVEVSINGEKHRAGPGAFVFFASNDVHSLENAGDKPATYYVINFYTDATRAVRDQPAAEWAPKGTLRSCVINWDDTVAKVAPNDTRRSFVNAATLTFTNLEIHATTAAAGRYPVQHPGHLHLLLVIEKEGTMDYNVDGVTHAVGAGSIAFIAPGAVQILRNRGSVPATYYVIAVSSEDTPKG